jgi:hypothetical protein
MFELSDKFLSVSIPKRNRPEDPIRESYIFGHTNRLITLYAYNYPIPDYEHM